jgi:P27 family predicted phage terminase small subunit
MANHKKSAEHRAAVGRRPGVDAAGNRLPVPVPLRVVESMAPAPPETLSETGRQHWERIFGASWVLPAYDIAGVARLCELYEQRGAMRESLRKDGWMLWTAAGQPKANPLVGHMGKLDNEIRQLEVEFGLTPAARSRLGYSEVRRLGKLDEMMRRQKAR